MGEDVVIEGLALQDGVPADLTNAVVLFAMKSNLDNPECEYETECVVDEDENGVFYIAILHDESALIPPGVYIIEIKITQTVDLSEVVSVALVDGFDVKRVVV